MNVEGKLYSKGASPGGGIVDAVLERGDEILLPDPQRLGDHALHSLLAALYMQNVSAQLTLTLKTLARLAQKILSKTGQTVIEG